MTIDHRTPHTAPPRPDLAFLRRRVRAAPNQPEPVSEPGTLLEQATPELPAVAPVPALELPGISAGKRLRLTQDDPMIALTRVQSGIGCLVVAAHPPPLNCVYALSDGRTGLVTAASPSGGGRPPVRLDGRSGALVVDLRRCGELVRLTAFTPPGHPGADSVTVTTASGCCLDIAVDGTGISEAIAVFLSLFNVSGEVVVRAETPSSDHTLHDLCRSYDYPVTA